MKLRVMVVEDDALILMNNVDILEELGYAVSQAATGAKALQYLAIHQIDVLLADVGLPDMSGVTLATQATALWPSLVVIFATGRGRVDEAAHLSRSMVLTKPYDFAALEAALTRAIAFVA